MLFLSGWRVNDILDGLTFSQLQLVIQCMLRHKADVANFVMDSISQALGGKVKNKASRNDSLRTDNQSMSKNQDSALNKLQSMGINIRQIKE